MPLRGLLSDGFAAERRALIDPNHAATSPVPPGDPYPYDTAGEAAATAEQSETTTHLTVSDRWGNVVSYTYTIESTGGNGIVVPGWGFLLNNELTDFNFDSLTHPNRVEGGKRPRSSMSPTIVLDDGQPFLALGSPGGSMIITTVLQILVDRLDLGATLPEAIAEPRASQRNTVLTAAEPAFINSPEGQELDRSVRSRVLDDGRDRRRDRYRVPRRRPRARGCGAAASRRRKRNGREAGIDESSLRSRQRQRSTDPSNRALPGTWSAASSAGPTQSRAS